MQLNDIYILAKHFSWQWPFFQHSLPASDPLADIIHQWLFPSVLQYCYNLIRCHGSFHVFKVVPFNDQESMARETGIKSVSCGEVLLHFAAMKATVKYNPPFDSSLSSFSHPSCQKRCSAVPVSSARITSWFYYMYRTYRLLEPVLHRLRRRFLGNSMLNHEMSCSHRVHWDKNKQTASNQIT